MAAYKLSQQLADYFAENFDEFENAAEGSFGKPTMYSDLMTWALAMVNWDEVAKALIEDAAEVNA